MKKGLKRFMKKSVGMLVAILMLVSTFISPITVLAASREDLRTLSYNEDGETNHFDMHLANTGILTWSLKSGYTQNKVYIYERGGTQPK